MSNIIITWLQKGIAWLWLGFRHWIQGGNVSSKFFQRHISATSVILMAGIVIIGMRFQCLVLDNRVSALEDMINTADTEKQAERSRFMNATRESIMLHKVDSLGLGITVPDKHPEILHLTDNDSF